MPSKKQGYNPLSILRASLAAVLTNQALILLMLIIILVEWIVIDFLFFYPRYPLNAFFEPIISQFWTPNHMRYPLNLSVVPQLFTKVQYPLAVIFRSFVIGLVIVYLKKINNDETINPRKVNGHVLSRYIHLLLISAIIIACEWGLFKVYDLVIARAQIIRSTSGWTFWIKVVVLEGAPYFKLIGATMVTFVFAYAMPLILLAKQNVFKALFTQLGCLFRTFWSTFFIVLLPSLFILIVILANKTISGMDLPPEMTIALLVIGVCVLAFRDVWVYSAITTRYLLLKEDAA